LEGRTHHRTRRAARLILATSLVLAVQPGSAGAAISEFDQLPYCGDDIQPTAVRPAAIVVPWQTVLDADGVVVGHRVTIRQAEQDVVLGTGRRSFARELPGGRFLVGERSASGTKLTMVDPTRACNLWQRDLDELAYDVGTGEAPDQVRLDLHDPATRQYEGQLVLGVEHGSTEAMIDGECSTTCHPNDGDLLPADFGPAVAARPVPPFAAGGWPRDSVLRYSWLPGDVPPSWAQTAIRDAAVDASTTSGARSPAFDHQASANDTIRYSPLFPEFCRFGIACATRDMPAFWAAWVRPHGTEFSWGTLRWCQKEGGSGCFDLRRAMLHELGHVLGLNHPSAGGFELAPAETVMHAITPARPAAGSTRHAFGRCDVATLQELYDVPTNSAPISTCNDVATNLRLSSSKDELPGGDSVRLRAVLRVPDRPAFGQLAGNVLNDRSVKLRYRATDSDDAWTVLWMRPQSTGGVYELTIDPLVSSQFQATYPATRSEGLRFSESDIVKVKVNHVG
jgi:hypothetical protein